MRTRDEMERPVEWLRQLAENPELCHSLIEQAGVGVAAYRLAVARNRVRTQCIPLPTLREVRIAARELANMAGTHMPHDADLVGDCRHAGLPVITPSGFDRHSVRIAANSSAA
jgi:hypothetical protein